MKKIYWIRHGITEGIEKHWYYGNTDMPLTEAGHAMCAVERANWNLPEKTAYATSGMLRAEQTLEGLFGPRSHRVIPELREMNVGEFECKTYDELKDVPAYQAWLSDTTGETRIPGGESNHEFRDRVVRGLNALLADPADEIAVVCHGGVICAAMFYLFPEARGSFYDWSSKPCHGYAAYFEQGRPVRFETL